ncbi:MAG: pentapeptide repeat family protein [Micavibrio sp.]|nr:pentapeptide repeat family protein [Micavibrio sp.]
MTIFVTGWDRVNNSLCGDIMHQYSVKSASTETLLFSGQYRTLSECVAEAVACGVSMRSADFRNANLINAELDGGDFSGALFSGANLTGANLSEADLRRTDFSNAVLHGAILCDSDLSYSDFSGALFGATEIAGATLLNCIFSTLSAFTLPFDEADMIRDCIFINSCETPCPFSRQPLVVRGLSAPVMVMDRHIKIGHQIFPLDSIPAWIASGNLAPRNLRLRLEQVVLSLIMDDKRPKIA